MATITNYDEKVKTILNKILVAARDSNFGYYEDYQVKDYTDENKKVRMTMSVIVPEAQRTNAKTFLTRKLRDYKYPVANAGQSGVSIVVNPHPTKRQLDVIVNPDDVQVIRVMVKPSNSGGARGGSTGARITESAQALYCALRFNVLDSDIPLSNGSAINTADFQTAWQSCDCDATLEEVLAVEGDWQKSCILGANKLYKAFKSPPKNYYKFYRGSGVDALINQAYLKVKNEEPLETVPGSEDKWNPADIWIAKSDFDSSQIPKAASKGLVLNLNQFLEEQFNTTPYQTLAGISLKQIKSSANIAKVNISPVHVRSKDIGFKGYRSTYKSIDVYVDMGKGEMQFRNFGSESSAGWQGEISGGGAPAQGKMGGAEVWTILNRFGAGYVFNNQSIWRYSDESPRGISKENYDLMKTYLPDELPQTVNQEQEVISEMVNGQINTKTPRSYRYSKRLGLQVIDSLSNMKKEDADEAIKDIYLYASSQTKTSSIHWKLT
tara:strand:- start:1086 stop:2567 length:1482 start_codon:yes stop_codon:yes gene_type:complete